MTTPVVIETGAGAVSNSNPLPVSATITPSGTQDVNLVKVGGSGIAIGQAAMAASLPVAIASNQSAVPVAISPSSSSALGIVPVVSSALETGHVIKGTPGNLYGLNVATTTVGGYVQIFNSTTVPVAGAVTPVKAYAVPANSALVVGFDPPLQCATGISVAFSTATTPFTKTDSTTAFFSGDAV